MQCSRNVADMVQNAAAMWVPIHAKYGSYLGTIWRLYWCNVCSMAALLSKILEVFVMLKRDVRVVIVVFCVRD